MKINNIYTKIIFILFLFLSCLGLAEITFYNNLKLLMLGFIGISGIIFSILISLVYKNFLK